MITDRDTLEGERNLTKENQQSAEEKEIYLENFWKNNFRFMWVLNRENIFSASKTEICSPMKKLIIVPAKKLSNAREKIFGP